jgi:hypothetical protein
MSDLLNVDGVDGLDRLDGSVPCGELRIAPSSVTFAVVAAEPLRVSGSVGSELLEH